RRVLPDSAAVLVEKPEVRAAGRAAHLAGFLVPDGGARKVAGDAAPLVGHQAGVVAAERVSEVAALDVERGGAAIVFLDERVASGRVQEGQVGAAGSAPAVAGSLERDDGLLRPIGPVLHEAQPFLRAGVRGAGHARILVEGERPFPIVVPVAAPEGPGLPEAAGGDTAAAQILEERLLLERDHAHLDPPTPYP